MNGEKKDVVTVDVGGCCAPALIFSLRPTGPAQNREVHVDGWKSPTKIDRRDGVATAHHPVGGGQDVVALFRHALYNPRLPTAGRTTHRPGSTSCRTCSPG